jgi:hypothetical protein
MAVPAQPAASEPTPIGILVASALCWIWGLLSGLIGIVLLVPALRLHALGIRAIILTLRLFLAAVVYCATGYLVRKGHRAGGWFGVICASLVSASLLLGISRGSPSLRALPGLAINLAILVLLAANWRRLRAMGARVGA